VSPWYASVVKRIPLAVLAESRRLFWDVDPNTLDPARHEDFILGRVMSLGSWEAIRALEAEIGDDAFRDLVVRAPHRLSARARRFFEVVLSIPEAACTQKRFRRSSERLFPR
jgi:hypothetical protein